MSFSSKVVGRLETGDVPLILAVLGCVILAIANAQPFEPTAWAATSAPAPEIGRFWGAAATVTPMATVGVSLLFSRMERAAWMVGVLGLVAVLLSVFPFHPAVSVDDLMTEKVHWFEGARFFVLPFLAATATALMTRETTRSAASGFLMATGVGAYLFYARVFFGRLYNFHSYEVFPLGRGVLLGAAGAAALIAAAMIPGAGAVRRPGPSGGVSAARVTVALVGAVVMVIAFLQYLRPNIFGFSNWFFWLASVGLAVAALVLALCSEDRRFVGGVLTVAGALLALDFPDSSDFLKLVFPNGQDWSSYPGGLVAGDIGFGAGVVLLTAGAGLMLTGRTGGNAVTAPDTGPVEPVEPQAETTRYLCAGAYLDRDFARATVREVLNEEHRAAAPSFGIDVAMVTRHCVAAQRRRRVLDTVVVLLTLPVLLLLLFAHTRIGLQDVLVLLVMIWLTVAADRWILRYGVIGKSLSRKTFPLSRPPLLPEATERQLARAATADPENLLVYGTYSPFVGSGTDQGGWSFALSKSKGKKHLGNTERCAPREFETASLYAAIRHDLEELGLDGLMVEDRLLTDGQALREDSRFLPESSDRPPSSVGRPLLSTLVGSPELGNRVYQCVRVTAWDGDLTLSIFINLTQRGNGLFAEVRYFLLAPVKETFREVDRLVPDPGLVEMWDETWRAARGLLPAILRAPRDITGDVFAALRRWRRRRKVRRALRTDPAYNFGAMTGVRELAQAASFRRYFQQVDRNLTVKLIEREILDSIIKFLDACDIDTSELKEQQIAILNNGLFVSGGTVEAGSLAIGQDARARTSSKQTWVGRAANGVRNRITPQEGPS